ncbi:MAG: hypothetical protein ABWZ08_00165 [Pseudoxanthomonas sp.]
MKILESDFSERNSSAYSTAWGEKLLLELEAHLPRMHRECDAIEFWQWLRGETDSVQRCLPTEEQKDDIKRRIDALVRGQIGALERGSPSRTGVSMQRS